MGSLKPWSKLRKSCAVKLHLLDGHKIFKLFDLRKSLLELDEYKCWACGRKVYVNWDNMIKTILSS